MTPVGTEIYTSRWGRRFVLQDEGSGVHAVIARWAAGERSHRVGFVQHKSGLLINSSEGWDWACTLNGNTTYSKKRFRSRIDALHALVGSGRVKAWADR